MPVFYVEKAHGKIIQNAFLPQIKSCFPTQSIRHQSKCQTNFLGFYRSCFAYFSFAGSITAVPADLAFIDRVFAS
jgi:hypothetical protein